MSKAVHTPTPWHIMYLKAFDYTIVESIGERVICKIDGQYPTLDDKEENEDRHHADAQIIVNAVNHHQELVTRLYNLVNALDLLLPSVDPADVQSTGVAFQMNEARETLKKVIQ